MRPPSVSEVLRERLGEIAAAAVAPEDALEPALRAILEASRAQAGALCLFDQRHGILRLVAEVGFSEEGCRRLRNVRRTDPTAWDMPLNGLMNRRAYLIESASRNRYVPRLVEHAAAVRTIACLPLHAGPTPRAVKPTKSGVDATANDVAFDRDLAIGITSSSAYDQLTVVGNVDLSGVNLLLTGGFTPVGGEAIEEVMRASVEDDE